MATTKKTLNVSVDSEQGRLLHDALTTGSTILVDIGEATYRGDVARAPGAPAPPSSRRKPTPEEAAASRAAIYEAAGSWKDVDAEAFKAYIAERRRMANRPSIKPRASI